MNRPGALGPPHLGLPFDLSKLSGNEICMACGVSRRRDKRKIEMIESLPSSIPGVVQLKLGCDMQQLHTVPEILAKLELGQASKMRGRGGAGWEHQWIVGK